MSLLRNKVFLILLLAGLAAAGWWQRQPLLAWWQVHQLTQADDATRTERVDAVVALDAAATGRLVAALRSHDEAACVNVQCALEELAKRWGPKDARALTLVERFQHSFAGLSSAGQAAALRTTAILLDQARDVLPARVTSVAGDLLKASETNSAVRPATLQLAAALLDHVAPGQWRDACRALALQGIHDPSAPARIAAIRLMLSAALRDDDALLATAVPLLRDPAAEVRRAAVVALAPLTQLVSEDDLLPLLHDDDLDVQRSCELALRGRGLQDHHLEMARLISDERPVARLQVLQHLRDAGGVDAGVWLRRLTQDTAPAVRAAAVRAAADQQKAELRDRLIEMHRQDDSATVRELAGYYLNRAPK